MASNSELNTSTTPEPAHMNFFERLSGIYFEPGKTFQDINRKSTWLGIFIVISLLSVTMLYIYTNRIPRETRRYNEIASVANIMPEKQVEEYVNVPPSAFEKFTPLFTIASILILYLILSAIFLLTFMMMGASLSYKKTLAVTCWGFAPSSIVSFLIIILLLFIKDPTSIDLSNLLMSHLGFLVSKNDLVLYSVLNSIDIFSIWTIIWLSIGFEAVSGGTLTKKKSAVGIVILWILYLLGKTAFMAVIQKIIGRV